MNEIIGDELPTSQREVSAAVESATPAAAAAAHDRAAADRAAARMGKFTIISFISRGRKTD